MKRILVLGCLAIMLALTAQAHGATWYAAASGSGTSCTSTSPCALSYTIATKSQSGDTIIVNSGAYSGTFTLNKPNVTVTTTPAVISALGTFTRGIPSGTDNRPIITGEFVITASGCTVSYMRVTKGGRNDNLDFVAEIEADNVTLSYSEFFNGHNGIKSYRNIGINIIHCYIHGFGNRGTSPDDHGIAFMRTGGSQATSFSNGALIQHCTIKDTGGDGVQDQSACTDYGGIGPLSYLWIDDCEGTDFDEQFFDGKGTQYVRISNSNLYKTTAELIINTTPTDDCSGARIPTVGWEIYNNVLHDNTNPAIMTITGGNRQCQSWKVYNNVIYNTSTSPGYNYPAVLLACTGTTTFYNNTLYNNATGSGGRGGIAPCGNGANVKNNIFYGNGSYGGINMSYWDCTGSGTPSYNYVYPVAGTTGTNAVTTSDPGFNNATGHDFALKTSSVCKDAGTTLALPYNVDILGIARPTGTRSDLGAYEWTSEVVQRPSAPENLTVIP